MTSTLAHKPTVHETATSASLSELVGKPNPPKQGVVVVVEGERYQILALEQSASGFGGVAAVKLDAAGQPTSEVQIAFPGTDSTNTADLLANKAALPGTAPFSQASEVPEFMKVALNNLHAVTGKEPAAAQYSVYGHSAGATAAYKAAEYLGINQKVAYNNFVLNITEPAYLGVAVESSSVAPEGKKFFEGLYNQGNLYAGCVVNANGDFTFPMAGNMQDLAIFPKANLYSIHGDFDANDKIAATQAHRMAEVLPQLQKGNVGDSVKFDSNATLAELTDGKHELTASEKAARAQAPMFIDYLLTKAGYKETATPSYMDIPGTAEDESKRQVAMVTERPKKKDGEFDFASMLQQFSGNGNNMVLMFVAALVVDYLQKQAAPAVAPDASVALAATDLRNSPPPESRSVAMLG